MKRMMVIVIGLMISMTSFGYGMSELFSFPCWTATNNWFYPKNGKEGVRANGLIIGPKETVLYVELKPTENRERMCYWTSRQTYLQVGNKRLPFIGTRSNRDEQLMWLTREDGSAIDWGWNNVKKGESYYYNLVFNGRFPFDEMLNTGYIELIDGNAQGEVAWGYSLSGIDVSAPPRGGYYICEMEARRNLHDSKDPIAGIYESTDSECWRIYCRKKPKETNGDYELLFLENGKHAFWEDGDLKAVLHPTATKGVFKADWTDESVHKNSSVVVAFDGAMIKVAGNEWPLDNGRNEMTFLKMYPADVKGEVESKVVTGGGSGFALKNGYLVTNHHVIDGATDIRVWRERGGQLTKINAKVVIEDKERDLALLKLERDVPNVPYKILAGDVDVGEEIFALGYPKVETMGKEMKLTTGVISSAAGFQDDRSNYQISAAIQPGNSGGPLFNAKGQIAGVVVAKHLGAENVNYAIKSRVLRDLLIEHDLEHLQPDGSTLLKLTIAGKVKVLREYVYRIECSYGGKLSSGGGRKVEFPKIEKASHKDTDIVSVVLNDDSTIVELGMIGDSAWIHPETRLRADGLHSYKMSKVEGLPTKSKEGDKKRNWQYHAAKIYFPAVPKNTKLLDFIEPASPEDGPFDYRGIDISGAK